MNYDDAEAAGSGRQDTDGTPTLAQWARAQALTAIMATDRNAGGLRGLADQVNILAELIVTGSLPKPPPGVTY